MPQPRLTERDEAILDDLYRLRYMTGSQIERQHFTSTSARNRRLALLIERGFIRSFDISNVPERVFRLSPLGARIVAGGRGVEVADLHLFRADRRVPQDHYFMRHHLAGVDLRLALESHFGRSEIGFIPEFSKYPAAHGGLDSYLKDEVSYGADTIRHTPDGLFKLDLNGRLMLHFIEVDRGTEVISNPKNGVLKFIRYYALYLKSGRYRRFGKTYKSDPLTALMRVLIVTLSDERVKSIRETLTDKVGARSNTLDPFLITTLDRALDEPGGAVWLSLNSSKRKLLRLTG